MSAARKVMLITGASGGIGADLARIAASNGHDLALVARNRAALDALADEIAALPGQINPRPLVFDCDLSQSGAPPPSRLFWTNPAPISPAWSTTPAMACWSPRSTATSPNSSA